MSVIGGPKEAIEEIIKLLDTLPAKEYNKAFNPDHQRTLMVDPPEGWRFGFPCELPEGVTLEELFNEHNYPEEMRELGHKYSRYWYA